MAFKSFKYKLYAKGYHHSTATAAQSSTSFFDNGYYYYQQMRNRQVLHHVVPEEVGASTALHPAVVANNNFNNLECVLALHHDHDDSNAVNAASAVTANVATGDGTDLTLGGRKHKSKHKRMVGLCKRNDNSKTQFVQKRFISNATNIESRASAAHFTPAEALQTADLLELEKEYNWEKDTDDDLNPQTYLSTHIDQINKHFVKGNYNIINALYKSLKRNGIAIQDREVLTKVLISLARREMDDLDIDNKVFELLSCYQDIITNRIKPNLEIYNIVLETLFKSSIVAFKNKNGNGIDFYKIGSELLQTIMAAKDMNLSNDVINYCLLSTNLYPSFIQLSALQQYINILPNYKKDSFYYISCLSYARLNNDLDSIKKLYEDYRQLLIDDPTDMSIREDQYKVYSMFVSGLVECGELNLASKFLETFISKIRAENGSAENISTMLSTFIISVSKIDCNKAHILWSKFNRLSWVPEFSYEFYLTLLANCFQDWGLTKKVYEYMFPMRRVFKENRENLSEYLLYPMGLESVLNSLMDFALQLKDTQIVLKLLEEAIVKGFTFETGIYPFIFAYLKEVKCPEDYLLRLIQNQGELLLKSEKPEDVFMFFNAIADNFASQSLKSAITEMDLFTESCRNFHLVDSNKINFQGFLSIFENSWNCPKTHSNYAKLIQLHAILVTRLLDFETFPLVEHNEHLSQLKLRVIEKFQTLCTNYMNLNFDPNHISETTCEALRLIDAPENLINYFSHPGDWDKSYPLSLGSMIRISPSTGIKEYKKLLDDGYCFDYDTYKTLLSNNMSDLHICRQILKQLPIDEVDECKYISNILAFHATSTELTNLLLTDEKSIKYILPNMRDSSMVNFIKNCGNIEVVVNRINFPEKFRGIAVQAERKETIKYIYGQLFKEKCYQEIIEYNKSCPVLDLNVLLKSFIRTGDYGSFLALFDKYRDTLGSTGLDLQVEYLINNGQIDSAIEVVRSSNLRTPHKTMDLFSFANFLKSFECDVAMHNAPENTLQLANILSTQNSFAGILSVFDMVRSSGKLQSSEINLPSVKNELLSQMFNNLDDAVSFFGNIDGSIQEVFRTKLQSLLRFKAYLKLPILSNRQIHQLVSIWSAIDPFAIDALFNNIVESFYLDDKVRILYLNEGITYPFNMNELNSIIDQIAFSFADRNDQENVQKARTFKIFLETNYIPSTIKFKENIAYS
ncbi:related to Ribonuclease P protein component, mitochondrial [Nakaseomyces glabratus]|nr:Mitochondrial ribonuclease P subunit (RPM2) [Nakaseomyces glabratus]QNG14687.1 RPM2 [Nakaseomyces glabratus]SCV14534.1 related to Ribonuclease P protein component, mitochondrial [Nakaseomyces glabratus]SLM13253.1 related to Ribonuclease P protein component, mitochondrial [Nakaseomyces glabratus]